MAIQEYRASKLQEIPILEIDKIRIKDYRLFVSDELKTYSEWGVFAILVADVKIGEIISTHVVGVFPNNITNEQIFEKFRQISERISIDNLRLFLAGLGTAGEVGAIYSGVKFMSLEDDEQFETVTPLIGASLALLVDDPEVKKQLETVRLDKVVPRINVLY